MITTQRFPSSIVRKGGVYTNLLWHASKLETRPGEIIRPRTDFWARWGRAYPDLKIIDDNRPGHCRSMGDSVFCCQDISVLSAIGFDFMPYIHLVSPLDEDGNDIGGMIAELPKHDILWHDPMADNVLDTEPDIITPENSQAYWMGKRRPFHERALWEYMLPAVRVRGVLKIDRRRFRYRWKHKL